MDARWQIRLLGGLEAEREGRILSRFRSQKTGILLAYLAYFLRRVHPRDALIELLWPDADLSAGRASLSVALSFLRQHLEPPGLPHGSVLLADRASVRLNPDAVTTDVATFEAALRDASRAQSPEEQCRCLTGVVDAYRGELLPGCYEEWVLLERERLAEAYLHALSQLIRLLEAQGDVPRALDYARRAVSVDPLREESHQELIRLLGAAGQPRAARRQFAELERLLKEELHEVPTAETRALLASLPSQPEAGSRQPVEEEPVSPTAPTGLADVPTGYRLPAIGSLPAGTITFLLTDIEGSTARWERAREEFAGALADHHALLRRLFRRHGGREVKEMGDGFLVAFERAGDALACAIAGQRVLASHPWPADTGPVRVRLALHTGDVDAEENDYHGPVLNCSARILDAAHGGQILCSQVTASLVRRDLEPGARLLDLGVYLLPGLSEPERLFQVAYAGMESERFPPLRAEPRHSGHLPSSFSRFFGREKERALLEKLLGSQEARLVTLMGPGGSGKTRLALEVVRQLVEEWRGAIWFVPLADLTEASRIPDAIRQALLLSPAATQEPLEQVAAALSEQPALLLLDNLEHLLPEGATLVQTLLEQVPTLTCLVTSRRRLNLSGERVFFVPPLPTPGEAECVGAPPGPLPGESLERLLACESVQLLVDRARAGSPEFALTQANAGAVAELCRRLEGLPLALELAAARAGVLTPGQILAQLERGLGVLSSRRGDAAARHRSLRAAVEWSYRLLDPSLQQFFRGLCVFRGGWSLEAAEAVCGDCGLGESASVLDALEQLRECSLVLAEEAPSQSAIGHRRAQRGGHPQSAMIEMRFRLLETLREFGWEQLGEPARSELERRHAEYFQGLAERAKEEIRGGEQQPWLERLEAEHDNLRAALSWAVARGEAEIGLRLAVALEPFWSMRGYFSEGRERLAAVLDLAESSRPGEDGSHATLSLRAWALRNAGALAWRQGDYGPARTLLEESLALQRRVSDSRGVVGALHILGNVAYEQSDYEAAGTYYRQALDLAREIGASRDIGVALANLACVASDQSDYETARRLFVESLALFQEIGDRYDAAHCLGGLGVAARAQGDWESARAYYDECLALRRELGDKSGVAYTLYGLGLLTWNQGDYGAARACLEESLALQRELGDNSGIACSLYGLGMFASQEGDGKTAQTLLEESLAMARKQGERRWTATSLAELGALASRRGEYGAARALLEESLASYQEVGRRQGSGYVLCYLGSMAADQGDEDAAGRYYQESLGAFRAMGERYGMAQALEGLARVAFARGDAQRAAQLYGTAAALREVLGAPVYPADRAAHERRVDAVRASLGEEAFVTAWAEGRAMPLEQALCLALVVSTDPV